MNSETKPLGGLIRPHDPDLVVRQGGNGGNVVGPHTARQHHGSAPSGVRSVAVLDSNIRTGIESRPQPASGVFIDGGRVGVARQR